jgi:hypothetical protein
VDACGYFLSCLALNGATSQGFISSGAYQVLENCYTWLPGARLRAEPGHEDKVAQADRRQNPARLWPLRWGKGLVGITPESSSF